MFGNFEVEDYIVPELHQKIGITSIIFEKNLEFTAEILEFEDDDIIASKKSEKKELLVSLISENSNLEEHLKLVQVRILI